MIKIFNHYVSKLAFSLLLLEALILLVVASLVSLLWFADQRYADNLYWSSLTFALVMVFSMSALGMYQQRSRDDLKNTLSRVMPSFALGFVLLSLLVQVAPALAVGRGIDSLIFLLGAVLICLIRLLFFKSAHSALLEARLILVGAGPLAKECLDLATSKLGFHQFHVVGCVALPDEAHCVPESYLLPAEESLLRIAQRYRASEIVVTVSNRRSAAFPVRQLLECALGGIKVIDSATFFEREACQIRVDSLQPSYLIFGGGFDQSFLRASVKRAFDLFASAVICLLSLPIMLAAALCIRLEDGGPVFYRQERVGKDGQPFEVLKFRSMRCDAERGGTPTWAATDDPRVTRVGQWIRKLRIDELPQILNVFQGQMSFVGPRPERAYFVDKLALEVAYYNVRHGIKPGITGLAQVRYQYGASVHDALQKLQYDLYYVKNNSLFLDFLILIDTVQVVLFSKGSR